MFHLRWTRPRTFVVGLLLTAVPLGGLVLAENPAGEGPSRVTADTLRYESPPARSLNQQLSERRLAGRARANDLLPRITEQLRRRGTSVEVREPDYMIGSHLRDERRNAAARQDVTRATRTAVRDFLLETTTLDRTLENTIESARAWARLKLRRQPAAAPSGAGDSTGPVEAGAPNVPRRKRFGVDVSFHRLEPKLQMRYRTNVGALRFSLTHEGSVGLKFSTTDMRRGEIDVRFNGDDQYHLLYNLRF